MNETSRIISNQRHLFDIPEDVAYLNCAFISPAMRAVVAAGEDAIQRKQHPWRITPENFFDRSDEGRSLFARIIGASAEDVAIVPSVSYGIAVAAANIPVSAGQEVVILEDQFPSNVYPWRALAKERGATIVAVPRPQHQEGKNVYDGWTPGLMEAIGPKTALVALPHCHWTDGSLIDLKAVREAADAAGAALVLDVTQSCGAWPIDVAEIRPDFLVSASYKWLLGPYSLGFLYIAPKWQEGRPLEQTWLGRAGAEDFARLVDYTDEAAPGVRRFDMGERSQFQLMPMALAAMGQILDWGVENIAATLTLRTRQIADRAAAMGLVPIPEEARAGHYLGLGFPNGLPEGLREGLRERQVYISVRGHYLRVTPHLYNTDADVERLFEALEAVV